MKELVQSLPVQLTEALMIGRSYQFKARPEEHPISNVILTGLGGSGIGGSIVQNYVFGKLKVPFVVNKDYFLPAFVGKDSLVIVSSYSGNTEETIAAMKQAMKAGAYVVCITSGGKVAEMAKKKNIDCILLPAGNPPRASLAYSLVEVLFTLKGTGLLKVNFEKEIEAAIALLNAETKDIQKKAKSLAGKLIGKLPIFYASAEYEGFAIRVRQQINENSKMLAWHGVIPEMNHNELVGWRDKAPDKAVVIFRTEDDYERNQTRMEINKKIIKKYTPNLYEVYAKGKSYLEKLFYFIHLTDWLSVDLADLHGVDATEVKVIDYLKGELAGS